jgi:hypothetical protein
MDLLDPTTVTGRSYATLHPTISASTGLGAMVVQAPTFSSAQLQGHEIFLIMTPCQGLASPRHPQLWHANTTTTTMRTHEQRGKLAIGSTLEPFSFCFCTFRYCNPIPPFAYYKRGGRDPQREREMKKDNAQQWQCTKHTPETLKRTHSQRLGCHPYLD